MAKKISPAELRASMTAIYSWITEPDVNPRPPRSAVGQAVRHSLAVLAQDAPGQTVEVRIPPYGAVQCVSGPIHTRGTPPNIVEAPPLLWLQLVCGIPPADIRIDADASPSGQSSVGQSSDGQTTHDQTSDDQSSDDQRSDGQTPTEQSSRLTQIPLGGDLASVIDQHKAQQQMTISGSRAAEVFHFLPLVTC